MNGLRRKSISKIDPQTNVFSGKLENLAKSSFCDKMNLLFMHLFWAWAPDSFDGWRDGRGDGWMAWIDGMYGLE